MTRYVVLFPGYGSQHVGMGRALADNFAIAAETFAEADAILGYSLSQLCFDGSVSILDDIVNAQAAVLTVSTAAWRVFADTVVKNMPPSGLCGHSLGEMSALIAAASLSFADALRFVHERGLAVKTLNLTEGGMLAIMARDFTDLEAVMSWTCDRFGGILERASNSCATQVIIAGTEPALTRIREIYENWGALCTPLNASFPLHTSVMKPLARHMHPFFAQFAITRPIYPVMGSLNATWLCDVEDIREELLLQLSHTVQWAESVKRLLTETRATCVIELGPGRVLTSLMGCIDRSVRSARFGGDTRELQHVMSLLNTA